MKNNPDEKEILQLLDDNLKNYLPASCKYNEELLKSLEYSLYTGGKRIRPVLLLASCIACGGDIERAFPFACAIEFIHTYSLIHDDLPAMDNDDYRRGKPTNHKVFGEAIALLAGDELLTAANRIMSDEILKDNSVSKINAMSAVIKGAENMIMGQVADIKWTDSNNLEDIKYVHTNKTQALIYAAVMAGAYLADADETMLQKADCFARNFGFAFQVADDICDKDSDEGPNYVNVAGLEASVEELYKLIENAKLAISDFENKQILECLCDKVLNSIK